MALSLFEKRFRGFRVVEITAFACLAALVLGVYFSKAHAGHETAETDDIDQQIADTSRRVRLLDAELAHLEAPQRLERLSQQYLGFAAIAPKHEAEPGALMEVARAAAEPPAPAKKPAAPTPVSTLPVATVPVSTPASPGAPQ